MPQLPRRLAGGSPYSPDEKFPAPDAEDDELWHDDEDRPTDFLPAPQLEVIAKAIIERETGWGHLRDARWACLWRRAGGKAKGKATLGKTIKPSGPLKHFAQLDVLFWFAADHAREYGLTRWQMEALVYHELSHTAEDEHGALIVVGHEFEGFRAELEKYGAWNHGLQAAADGVQASLWETEPRASRNGGIDSITFSTDEGRSATITPETLERAAAMVGGRA